MTRPAVAPAVDIARQLVSTLPAGLSRQDLLGRVYDAGLTWVHFPPGLGGLGLDREVQAAVDADLKAAGIEPGDLDNPIGYGMCAPTIVEHAERPLAEELLRPLATGEQIWCQLYSEPGAGSDLASVATTAVPDHLDWVVSGQKVWTSLAHKAHYGLLLARTDPTAPKHAGLTCFALDMQSPGVDVRPLRQMTGGAEFNEVYLTDVRIPDTHRLGRVGDGWRVAMTTLMNERLAIGDGEGHGLAAAANIAVLSRLWAEPGLVRSAAHRQRFARLWVDAQAHQLTSVRRRRAAGTVPGPEATAAKVAGARLNQHIYELAMELLGAAGSLYDGYESGLEHAAPSIQRQFLRSRANTIEGGTTEVLLGILAERVLGLPKEPRLDDGIPWKDIARG